MYTRVYTQGVTPAQAIRTIRGCVHEERYTIRQHVYDRMAERGLMLPDLLALVEDPERATAGGEDEYGRHRWRLSGTLPDGLAAEVVVAIDATTHATFFTIYWE